MGIFTFIIYLGIINIVFGWLWKWIFALPAAVLFTVLKIERVALLIKAFGAYLLISLTALATLFALHDVNSGWKLLFFPIIGAFVLFMGFVSNAYEKRREARYDFIFNNQLEKDSWFDAILMFGSLILYIIILFIPSISMNPMNEWLYNVVVWIYGLPMIGWIIGMGGLLFMISIIWDGIVMSFMLSVSVYAKIKGGAKNDIEQKKGDEDIA